MASGTHSAPVLHSTPPHNSRSGADCLLTVYTADNQRQALIDTMVGYFKGEMPVDSFIDEFLPSPDGSAEAPESGAHFRGLRILDEHEKTLYNPLIERVNSTLVRGKQIFPNHKLVNTFDNFVHAYASDFDQYQQDNNIDAIRVNIEVRRRGFDPFVEFDCSRAASTADPELSQTDKHPLESDTKSRVLVREQLISYATKIMTRQHRTHLFTLLILDQEARFIRWDRAGAIVSEAFNYTRNSQPLVDFFWRLGTHWDSLGGLDPTVRLADAAEKALAMDHLRPWAPTDDSLPIVVFSVPSLDGLPDQRYVAWGALAAPDSPIGRATRGWVVCNVETEELGFLKDAWCSPQLLKETETLLKLQKAGCRNVPTLVCGGDLEQVTRTQDYVDSAWSTDNSDKIILRRHIRFVVKEVGLPLSTIKHSSDLLRLVFDALLGHKDAFVKCRLLHRDVSAGNILIVTDDDGRRHGMLNDWDLATHVNGLGRARTPDRAGTWQFMSHRILMSLKHIHQLQDDLESFLYVTLYQGLVYCEHKKVRGKPVNVPALVKEIFDEGLQHHGKWFGGNGKYVLLFTWFTRPRCEFKNSALAVWLQRTTRVFRAAMLAEADDRPASKAKSLIEASQETLTDMEILNDHTALQNIWQQILNELPPSPLNDKVPFPGGYLGNPRPRLAAAVNASSRTSESPLSSPNPPPQANDDLAMDDCDPTAPCGNSLDLQAEMHPKRGEPPQDDIDSDRRPLKRLKRDNPYWDASGAPFGTDSTHPSRSNAQVAVSGSSRSVMDADHEEI
ncbi:hypothetical protein HGRIS_011640 [Hohenbuehelia grisea]|uniref:Fungal-type protein kinase domain-containing protein n=1 Tax=Hohenbuehelia grisea TaxID=104357 RepID=A0ABR3JXY4_9AGAR